VPGVIAAIVLSPQPATNQQPAARKSLGQSTNPVVLIAVALFAAVAFYSVYLSAIHQSASMSPSLDVASSSQPTTPVQANATPASSQSDTGIPPVSVATDTNANATTNGAPSSSETNTSAPPVTVATDNAEAAAYRIKATAGDAKAAEQLGYLYLTGQGVTKDLTEALKWIQIAADNGNVEGEYNLATIYYDGQGVVQDYNQALNWYRRAADQGLAEAQYCVGHMYENGQGTNQDTGAAVDWYKKAAVQGQSNAQAALKRLNVQY